MNKPTLLPNWKLIARKALSFRLAILAAILSGLEVVLPLFQSKFPPHIFALLSFLIVSTAAAARLFSQQGLSDNENPES